MTQQPMRFCSKCGTPLEAGQRFCANCGTTADANINNPTTLGPMGSSHPGGITMAAATTQVSSPGASTPPQTPDDSLRLTPPPPPDAYISDPYNSPPHPPHLYQSSPGLLPLQEYQQAPSGYQPLAGNFQAVPDFARPQKNASGPSIRRRAISLLTMVLLLATILGGGGYLAYRGSLSHKNSSSQTQSISANGNSHTESSPKNTDNAGSNNTSNTTNTPNASHAKITSFPTPLSFIYDNVQIAITDVKQAENFSDDANTATQSGVLRLDLKEKNTYSSYSSYYPTDAFNLLMPDGTTAQPVTAKQTSGIEGDVSRTDWVDFTIATPIDVSTLLLQAGKSTEAQINVPLKANADLSKYQPKVVNPIQQTLYGGLTWTLTKAETNLSFHGKQADAGSMFVTVTFRIDNNSSANFSGYDYLRLQSGQTTSAPTDNNVPTSFPAQQTNQIGTAIFVMPQGSTNFTVLLLASNNGSVNTPATEQATIQFQM